jgi:hypothetical protein
VVYRRGGGGNERRERDRLTERQTDRLNNLGSDRENGEGEREREIKMNELHLQTIHYHILLHSPHKAALCAGT